MSGPNRHWVRGVPYLLGAAGSACLAVAGGFALTGRVVRLDVAGWLGDPLAGHQALGLAADRLSGLFLVMTFGAAVPVSVAFASWAARADADAGRWLGPGYVLALGAVAVIVTAADAFTVLFGWEALTVAFYVLPGSGRGGDRAGAARVTAGFGKVSGAALLAGRRGAAGRHAADDRAHRGQIPAVHLRRRDRGRGRHR
jgi:hydrogenase-4 component B